MLAGDADGADAAAIPVAVASVVVGLAGRAEVMRSVDLDDDGAAVADHDEAWGPHASVAEPGPRQRQHGDRVLHGGLPLEFLEDPVEGKLRAAGEHEAVLTGMSALGALEPGLVASRLLQDP